MQVGSHSGDGHWRSSLDGKDFRESTPGPSERSEETDNSFTFNRLLQGPISVHPPPLLEAQSSDSDATPTFGGGRTWQLRGSSRQPQPRTAQASDGVHSQRIVEGDETQEDPQESPFASAKQQGP